MRIPLYQVDAFAARPFSGNPAAVCLLDDWLPEERLQEIAAENNLAETAFLVQKADVFELRWFTPTLEVELCGHATLASGWVVLHRLLRDLEEVRFRTRWRGELRVTRAEEGALRMDFPSLPPRECDPPAALAEGLGAPPAEIWLADHYLAVYPTEEEVGALAPEMGPLRKIGPHGVIASAPGTDADFVSRFFAPAFGVDEDPVTGSAHCTLTPYWTQRLGAGPLKARQISPRGGELTCELAGERVLLTGEAALYLEGEVVLPER